MKACPFCAEEIQDAAIVCKHCGRDLAPKPPAPAVPKRKKQGPAEVIAMLFGLSILGVAALVVVMLLVARMQGDPAPAPQRAARNNPRNDIVIGGRCHEGGFGVVAIWDITLKNHSEHTYRDIQYETRYTSESGNELRRGKGVFQIVLGPGETRDFHDFNDGRMPAQTRNCSIDLDTDWSPAD